MNISKIGRHISYTGKGISCTFHGHQGKLKSLLRYISSGHQRLSSPPKLHATPQTGLSDELLDIKATGLEAGQPVVLRAEVYSECGRFGFESHARYTADQNGDVLVSTHPSQGGTYTGIEPMGLIWSVQPMPECASKKPRLTKLKPAIPLVYKLSICGEDRDGGRSENQIELDSSSVERHFVAPYVQHGPIECGEAKGILYLPRKVGQSAVPFIIDMRGLGPSPSQDRAALLSSYGFGVFHVHYFESLKDDLQRQENGYFKCQLLQDVVNFATEHPYLDEDRIGINASCYGASLVLNAVSRTPDLPIRCIGVQRCYDILFANVGLETTTGKRIEPAGPPEDYTIVTKEADCKWFHFDFDHKIHDIDFREDSVAPVENLSVPLMLLICGDDQPIASEKCMRRMASRIQAAGKNDLLELHYLKGAGHLLETPYLPLCRQSRIYMPFHSQPLFTSWGGEPVLHARAQVTAWNKTLDFFRRHLEPDVAWRHDWRGD